MTIAAVQPASTVVVVRETPGPAGFEVLMVRRNDKVAFMAGAYVFPGGRVDDDDVARANGDAARAHRLAAVREVQEEAGVAIDPDDLMLIAHWVTPEIEIRRYDTRFFLALMPEGQHARHDADETTEFAWLSPREAIDRGQRGEIMLPPPTWTTLKQLHCHHSLSDLFAWARRVRLIPRIEPHFLKEADQSVLTLPGDPTYPTIDGWDVPEETRFVLRDGRWRPAPR